MARGDWFRQTTWNARIGDAFFRRLSRSKSDSHKAQHLRIQAGHLHQTRQAPLVRVSLELLELIFARYPETSQMAQSRLQQAHAFAFLGDDEGAIEAFRRALDAEKHFPNLQTQAWLDFGWFAVERDRQDLDEEVLCVLSERQSTHSLAFPVEAFRFHGTRALMLASQGRVEEAVADAGLAMDAAAKTSSGFRFHPTLGLVSEPDSQIECDIAALAAKRLRPQR